MEQTQACVHHVVVEEVDTEDLLDLATDHLTPMCQMVGYILTKIYCDNHQFNKTGFGMNLLTQSISIFS